MVTGRSEERIRSLMEAPGVQVYGLYGLQATTRPDDEPIASPGVRAEVDGVAASFEGAWVEDKGASLAVHYRGTADPGSTEKLLGPAMTELAGRHGLALLAGKMVMELAPRETPGKGAVILLEARARGLSMCLFAGDDLADLDAFAALDQLRAEGVGSIKVAVRSEETPAELLAAADLVVERPAGLIRLLDPL